ncbi:MAG: PIN domain-containing protein [Chthoniobacterales bacterium]
MLVDSSVWIDYFRAGHHAADLEALLDDNRIVTNDLIHAELIPALQLQRQTHLINLLRELERQPLRPDWDEVVGLQTTCLRKGINGVGIPDLLIAQHAMQHDLQLLARDRHFRQLARYTPLQLHSPAD